MADPNRGKPSVCNPDQWGKCQDQYGGRGGGGDHQQCSDQVQQTLPGGTGGSEDAGRISYGSYGRCPDRTGAGESSGKCSAPWEDIYKDLDHSDTHAGAGGDRCGG